MNNKLKNMLQEFLDNQDENEAEDVENTLQKFMEKYNKGELEYENTPLDDAYEILEKAENASSK